MKGEVSIRSLGRNSCLVKEAVWINFLSGGTQQEQSIEICVEAKILLTSTEYVVFMVCIWCVMACLTCKRTMSMYW